jgi:predicted XRE-type DNA-binding protein
MKSKTYKNTSELAVALGLTSENGVIAQMKASLTKEIIKTIEKKKLTHKEVSELSGVSRSTVTGVVNGSLQRVTIDRLIRVLSSLGKKVELKYKNVA